MHRKTKLILTTAAVAAAALGGGAAARGNGAPETEAAGPGPSMRLEDFEAGPEEEDVPITGTDLERAKAAALAYLGEGSVTETEVGDEESYYEVEVRLPVGRQVDVQLDESFTVVGVEGDGDGDD